MSNVFLGIGAGGNYPGSGTQNTFAGTQAGYSNNGSSEIPSLATRRATPPPSAEAILSPAPAAGYEQHHRHQQFLLRLQCRATIATGMNNIAFGAMAGSNNNNGNYNIYIGSPGQNTREQYHPHRRARISKNFAYMAGIYGNSPSGALPVVINANGQLGTNRRADQVSPRGTAAPAQLSRRPATTVFP